MFVVYSFSLKNPQQYGRGYRVLSTVLSRISQSLAHPTTDRGCTKVATVEGVSIKSLDWWRSQWPANNRFEPGEGEPVRTQEWRRKRGFQKGTRPPGAKFLYRVKEESENPIKEIMRELDRYVKVYSILSLLSIYVLRNTHTYICMYIFIYSIIKIIVKTSLHKRTLGDDLTSPASVWETRSIWQTLAVLSSSSRVTMT